MGDICTGNILTANSDRAFEAIVDASLNKDGPKAKIPSGSYICLNENGSITTTLWVYGSPTKVIENIYSPYVEDSYQYNPLLITENRQVINEGEIHSYRHKTNSSILAEISQLIKERHKVEEKFGKNDVNKFAYTIAEAAEMQVVLFKNGIASVVIAKAEQVYEIVAPTPAGQLIGGVLTYFNKQ